MGKSWLMCALLATMAWGQTAPPGAPATPPAPTDTSASVPDNAPVLTIDGVCAPEPKPAAAKGAAAKPAAKKTPASNPSADCKTVFTKAQFEQLANNLAPNITPQMRKQLASVLPRLMAMADEAKKQGLDKTPQYKERVKFRTMQVLAESLQQNIQEEAAKVSDADIEKYYKDHPENFEQYNLDRLFVPRTKQASELKNEAEKNEKLTEDEQKAKQAAEKAEAEQNEEAMTKIADDLRARAASGEDFLKLQKEAFEAAGMKIESPTVNLPSTRRTSLAPSHAAVFDLKPGEVSPVISDAGGHYIYKLNSKTEEPLEQAKAEIHGRLQNERMRESIERLNNSFKVETNEAYFGPGGPGAMPPRPGRPTPGMRPGAPPAGAASQPPTPPASQTPAARPN
ncbi:MAG TPA: peptidyl-prolyl cis-trans isomerase [Candidatus Binatia bacterium]|nr:peptidyl-prolyl cis-trans isomerase [Candidatus Binatia bacterium]